MSKKSAPEVSRREFLGSACCAAVGATGLLSTLGSLRLMGAAASPGNGPQTPNTAAAPINSDYKALVCLFLNGGNDANNLIVPMGTGASTDASSYAAYAAARSNLAIPRASLLSLAPKTADGGRTWGLHPSVGELNTLFGSGKLALLANAGTLVYPTSKAQYTARSVPLPPQLFSHSDQQVQWQHSVPDKPTSTGWGGRVADLVNAFNTSDQISMSISIAGKNTFQVGSKVSQYAISTSGAPTLTGATTSLTPTTADGIRYTGDFGRTWGEVADTGAGGLPSRYVLAVAPSRSASLWVSTLRGVGQWRAGGRFVSSGPAHEAAHEAERVPVAESMRMANSKERLRHFRF
jgi:uncharacterized protein (DUF1501 family)